MLAFEATKLTHGEEEAKNAEAGARKLFGGGSTGAGSVGLNIALVPTRAVTEDRVKAGIPIAELCAETGLCDSRNAARRLAKQGGLYLNGESAPADRVVTGDDLQDGVVMLRAGKKKHMQVVVQ